METTIRKIEWLNLSGKTKKHIADIIIYIFVLLFVYTASSKLLTLDKFKEVLTHYPIIGKYNLIIAYLVPISELVVSIFLIIPTLKKTGLIFSFVLMTLFLFYIIYMFMSKSSLPCSCGGIISKLSWEQHIWLNSILALIAFFGIRLIKH